LTVIVDNYDARRRRGYNGDLSVVEQQASRLLLMAMLCSFQGPWRAQPGNSRLVSQNSAIRAGRGKRPAPDSVDVL